MIEGSEAIVQMIKPTRYHSENARMLTKECMLVWNIIGNVYDDNYGLEYLLNRPNTLSATQAPIKGVM